MSYGPRDDRFWRGWHAKWSRRIECLNAAGHDRRGGSARVVRSHQIERAWALLEIPSHDIVYQPPGWWLSLSPEERRQRPRPPIVPVPVRAALAHRQNPGFSLDAIGPYLKLDDGSVIRDRRTAARRLWRERLRNPDLAAWIDWLSRRKDSTGDTVRGRTPERVLDALVARSLVELGLSQIDAARRVIEWGERQVRSEKRYAEQNRAIWRELGIPPVSR